VIAVIGAVAVAALVLGGGSKADAAQTMREAGCTYKQVEASRNLRPGMRHVNALPKGFKYNTFPPTSGLHNPQTIIWGIYDSPVNQLRSVHNMEHGGIVIQYGSKVPDATVQKLADFYRQDPNGIVVAPLPALGNKISLAAWTFDQGKLLERGYEGEGRLAICPAFDEGAFRSFVDAYRGKGPEPFGVDLLTPGNP
jgi:hypothetical protein